MLLPGLAVPLLASPISLKEQGHQPAKEEARGDAQAPLDEVSVPRRADRAPELLQEDTNDSPAEPLAVGEVRAAFSALAVEGLFLGLEYSDNPVIT